VPLWLIPVVVLALLVLLEVVFRVLYRRRHGRPYHVSIRFPWDRGHVIPHPYLSFAYKRNEVIDRNQRLPYPLHPNRYFSFTEPLRLNNVGHFGPDFTFAEHPGVLRIACLGNSTTANNVGDGERDYTYPALLEDELNARLGQRDSALRAEVYNCGIGGWVSTDILVDFLLNVLPTQPDYVILCHAFTELHLYLTEDFSLDYLHNRRNLGEVMHRIKRGYYWPKIRFWHSYEWAKDNLVGTGNVRNDVAFAIRREPPDLTRPYHDLRVEQRILRNIFIVCRHYGIRVIVGSYPFYAYRDDPTTLKMAEGVSLENALARELAMESGSPFVDQAALVPQDVDHFLDWIHLTPLGMADFARNFADALLADLERPGPPADG